MFRLLWVPQIVQLSKSLCVLYLFYVSYGILRISWHGPYYEILVFGASLVIWQPGGECGRYGEAQFRGQVPGTGVASGAEAELHLVTDSSIYPSPAAPQLPQDPHTCTRAMGAYLAAGHSAKCGKGAGPGQNYAEAGQGAHLARSLHQLL